MFQLTIVLAALWFVVMLGGPVCDPVRDSVIAGFAGVSRPSWEASFRPRYGSQDRTETSCLGNPS